MYRSIIVFVPLFLLGLLAIFWRELLIQKKKIFLGIIILCAIVGPFIPVITSKEGMIRSQQVGIQNNSFNQLYDASKKQQQLGSSIISKFIYNRRLVLGEIFINNYLSHFSPSFLFFTGDTNTGRHGVHNMGALYVWEIPFFLFGIFLIFKLHPKIRNVILLWILLAPIPAALSVPVPHALRSLNMLPMPQLLTGLGVVFVFWLLRSFWKTLYGIGLAIIIACFFILYLNNYYGYSAKAYSADFADGYQQLMHYILPLEKDYKKIIISGHYWNPYIYVLFYKKYNPHIYQLYGSRSGFDKYIFGGTSWEVGQHELNKDNLKKLTNANNVLVALSPQEYESQKNNIRVLKNIYNHNNQLVFIVGVLH
jgi:hypothetical protein